MIKLDSPWRIVIFFLFFPGIGRASSLAGENAVAFDVRAGYERVVRALYRVRMIASTKGDQLPVDLSKFPVWDLDLTLSGDELQARVVIPDLSDDDWETYREDAETTQPELKCCWSAKDGGRWAELRDAGAKGLPLYLKGSRDRFPPVFYLPFLQLHRSWGGLRGAWLAPNELISIPVEKWRVEGQEKIGENDVDVVSVFLDESSYVSKTSGKKVQVCPFWKCWMYRDTDGGFHPLRMERQVLYRVDQKEYPCVRNGEPNSLVYVADGVKEFSDGIWHPSKGSQESYVPNPKTSKPFDIDAILGSIERNGCFVDNEEYLLSTKRNFVVHKISPVDRKADLWIDPPPKVIVHDKDLNERFVSGVSAEESESLLLDKPASDENVVEAASPVTRLLKVLGVVLAITAIVLLVKRK